MRFALVVAVVACGRIGFEPIDRGDATGDGIVGGDGSAALDDGASLVCTYVSCTGQDVSCCDSTGTTCVADVASCSGRTVCDPVSAAGCPMTYQCCPRWPSAGLCIVDICP